MNSKILTLLGFASKSGKLSFGAAASAESLKTGKSKLIIICGDISDKSRKEIVFKSDSKKIPYIILEDITINTISNAVGRSCGILSVNDSSFASALTEEYGRKC